ncbi:MFS transporter, AGZA family, xanthine/uracil permease [Thermosulfidibacter takaii ABI70S6]|uniref:MFS transporter, AGZA family, xanthine/uracil permease n=1 Tax=Thermosulfidibacter takaii (strain DSM 17441 / JCM 13301 / NBRC 103674 / ABI70S6) TaxID=1298851 RepID=A0A0S3QR90_THET7|nr:NCS2 family permease [Thermosulfidibacter takaii]BAT70847.1 MFS transporter, AGZA family, xanthine/uracil permease [Thermosulfidibacter takaii ABI70S6]
MNNHTATEIRAGITTFITMAYIIFVNPQILSEAGMPKDGVVFATCVASAVATLIMGLYANYPFALAPGMGLNAYFTYGVVKGMGFSWEVALAAVFIEGLIFILLTISRFRSLIINSIPKCILNATPVGIGLFIALIGLKQAGFIQSSSSTLVTLGNLKSYPVLMAFLGIILAAVLMAKRVKGALLIVILGITLISILTGKVPVPEKIFGVPDLSYTFMKMDLSQIANFAFWKAVIAFLFVDLFDTIGTLSAVGTLGGFTENGKLPRLEKALMADAVGTTLGAILGTSTVTTYIESAAGVAEGGRTGLTAVVVAILFLASTLIYPLATIVPAYATAPALVLVGILMVVNVTAINWKEMDEALPAFLTLFFMPATYSIANGLAAGFISYPIVKTLVGKREDVSLTLWGLCIAFLLKIVLS